MTAEKDLLDKYDFNHKKLPTMCSNECCVKQQLNLKEEESLGLKVGCTLNQAQQSPALNCSSVKEQKD